MSIPKDTNGAATLNAARCAHCGAIIAKSDSVNDGLDVNTWYCRPCYPKRTKATDGAPRVHELKTVPPFFQAVLNGHKTFELRKNDRNFSTGDTLDLCEYDPISKHYTGRRVYRRVTYLLEAFDGLIDGYVIMGLGPT